jgi:hypothetical protein
MTDDQCLMFGLAIIFGFGIIILYLIGQDYDR